MISSPLFWGYALLPGFVAVITGEITFAMIGLIFVALNEIHRTIREVRDRLDRRDSGNSAERKATG